MPHATDVKRPILRAVVLIAACAVTLIMYAAFGAFVIGLGFGPSACLSCGMIGALLGAFITGAV